MMHIQLNTAEDHLVKVNSRIKPVFKAELLGSVVNCRHAGAELTDSLTD